jgi:membrane protein YqaA with SNARE-associated domain
MELLGLIALSFVGSVVWLVNTEGTAIVYGSQHGWHPLVVGVCCAIGQLGMHSLLYLGGERLLRRWRWLREREARVRARWGERLERRYLYLTGVAALTGVPPMIVLSCLAGGFGVPLRHYVAVVFPLRIVRFTVLAAVGQQIGPWLRSLF